MKAAIGSWAIAALIITTGAHAAAARNCKPTTALGIAQRALDVTEIQNVMSRYSDLNWANQFSDVVNLFALDLPDVSYKTPMGPTGGAAIKAQLLARQTKHDAGGDPVGMMHIHNNLTPLIEVAGDGKTAKAVWDSFGPDIANAGETGNWLYMRKAIDLVKVDGEWKIWHMQDYPVFNTPYDKSITQSAREGFNERRGGPPPGVAPPAGPPSDGASVKRLWIYDGKSVPQGPKLPVPYCTFDPKDAY